MKIFALILSIFAFVSAAASAAVASKSKAVCSLPTFYEGEMACRMAIITFSYDAATNKCVSWTYGGCGGNENLFPSAEECERTCLNAKRA